MTMIGTFDTIQDYTLAIDSKIAELLQNNDNVSWWKDKLKTAKKMMKQAQNDLRTKPNIDLGGPSGGCTHNGYKHDIEWAKKEIERCESNIARLTKQEPDSKQQSKVEF